MRVISESSKSAMLREATHGHCLIGGEPLRWRPTQRPASISLSSANLFPNSRNHRTVLRYKPIASTCGPWLCATIRHEHHQLNEQPVTFVTAACAVQQHEEDHVFVVRKLHTPASQCTRARHSLLIANTFVSI